MQVFVITSLLEPVFVHSNTNNDRNCNTQINKENYETV